MSQFRNISNDARSVMYGVPSVRTVAPDGVVTVDDDADESYAIQPAVWKPVGPPPTENPVPAVEAEQVAPVVEADTSNQESPA